MFLEKQRLSRGKIIISKEKGAQVILERATMFSKK
jgi:hypothetical protein